MGSRRNPYWTNESSRRDAEQDDPLTKEEDAAMTTTPVAHRLVVSAARPALIDLTAAVRHVIAMRADWARTAILVAEQLRAHLPDPGILTSGQRRGQPGKPAGHVLHAETVGTFSIVGLVWRPGQSTRIHDHITWCVVGVLQGAEHEDLYDNELNLIGTRE